MTGSLSVRRTLAGRRLLVTGASGFLGKVWLSHLLCELPEVTEVAPVLRPARRGGARGRLEELLATCPAFHPLHERHGEALGAFLGARLRPLEGDLTRPCLGLAPAEVERLVGRLDLVVHLGGLTTLDPALDETLAANVDGALHALELARETGAALLHVSTAYVAGRRLGLVPEALEPDAVPRPPAQGRFDARRELEDLRALVARTLREADDQRTRAALAEQAAAQRRALGAPAGEQERFEAREREAWVRGQLERAGRERARAWGWPNAYTLAKGLAESLLVASRGQVPLWVVRPTIVESALAFPFPGWKEGLQTSAPLTYALTHGPLRALPAQGRRVLDVIPVDHVARGLTLAAAGLLEARAGGGGAPRVLHLGSSALNPLTMERVVELTSLAHRRLERAEGAGPGPLGRLLVGDAVPTSPQVYRLTSVPLLRRLTREAGELCDLLADALPDGLPGALQDRARRAGKRLARAERRLSTLEEEVERFRPFVLEHDQTFAADGARALEARLEPEERAAFAADPRELDWRRYWMDVHVPGLRRWVYPRLEGRRLPQGPRRPVRLEAPVAQEAER